MDDPTVRRLVFAERKLVIQLDRDHLTFGPNLVERSIRKNQNFLVAKFPTAELAEAALAYIEVLKS